MAFKGKIIAPFTGVMDQDTDDRLIKEGDYILLENGIVSQDSGGGRYAAKNIKASQEVTTFSFSGTPLGATTYKGKIYAFYHDSSTDQTHFVEVDPSIQDSYTVLFTETLYDSDDEINYIDIVENHINGDLLCYWTDGVNQPFKVNITYLKNGGTYDSISDMYNIRPVPKEPDITPRRDYSLGVIGTRNKNFQFAQRWVYKDGEKTPLSTYSASAFHPDSFTSASYLTGGDSYYVDSGDVYRTDGFNNSSPIKVSGGYSSNYDVIYVNRDGDLLLMGSSTTQEPVMISTDRGATFVESTGVGSRRVLSACMSDDGDYIYYRSENHIWKSVDNGQTFSEVIDATDLRGEIKCSSNGEYLCYIRLDGAGDQTGRFLGYVASGYGDNLVNTVEYIVDAAEMTDPVSVGISSSGKNIYFALSDKHLGSSNYGDTFTTYSGRSLSNDVIVYDNGVGFADGFKTSNAFASIEGTNSYDRLWSYDEFFIGYDDATDTYTKYDLDEAALDTMTLSFLIAFVGGKGTREVLNDLGNFYNVVDVHVDRPNKYVRAVEVYAIDVSSGSVFLIEELNHEDDPIPVLGTTIEFNNKLIYRLLSDTEKSALFSNVPLKAQHQSIIGRRLFYLNYTDGFDLPVPDFNFEQLRFANRSWDLGYAETGPVDFVLYFSSANSFIGKGEILSIPIYYLDENNIKRYEVFKHIFQDSYSLLIDDPSAELQLSFQTMFPDGTVSKSGSSLTFSIDGSTYPDVYLFQVNTPNLTEGVLSYKDGHSLKIGILYLDEYNRSASPVFSDSDVNISSDRDNPIVKLEATINHTPPSWAKKYKFVRTDRDLFYRVLPGFRYAKVDDGRVYLMKYESDAYMPDPGMYLDVYGSDGKLYSFEVQDKVLKDADFVTGSPAGEWISIFEPDVPGFTATDISSGGALYYASAFYVRSVLDIEDDVLYYEIPGVFDIIDGYHSGNQQNQTASQPAIHRILNDGNCFWIPDIKVEVNSIGNNRFFSNGGRPQIVRDQDGEINRYASATWSDVFVQDSGYNGLSMFNPATNNSYDLDIASGAIQAVKPKDTNLFYWQDDQVGYLLINKNAITTASGDKVLTQQAQVVSGEPVVFSGRYGTRHLKSIADFGGALYFVDQKRNIVCRLSQNGITPISEYKLSSTLRSVVANGTDFIGAFNSETMEYWLYDVLNSKVYVFEEGLNGWTRVLNPFTASRLLSENDIILSLVGNSVYKENKGVGYSTIHGVSAPFKATVPIKDDGVTNMVFDAIELESNRALNTRIYIPPAYADELGFMDANIDASVFENNEGEYEAPIPLVGSNTPSSFTNGKILPLGEASGNVGGTVALKSPLDIVVGNINHTLKYVDGGGTVQSAGLLQSIDRSSNTITIDTSLTDNILQDSFVFLEENSYLNGNELRAPSARVEVTDNDESNKLYLFTIQVQQTKSE